VWGVRAGDTTTLHHQSHSLGTVSEPAEEGDVGCAEEANTRSPLPPSRAGGGG